MFHVTHVLVDVCRMDILLRHRVLRQHMCVALLGVRELFYERRGRQVCIRLDYRGGELGVDPRPNDRRYSGEHRLAR